MEVMGIQTGFNPLSEQWRPHREYNKIAGASIVNVGKWERIASGAIGAFLLYRAVKNRSWGSLLFGGGALSMLNRGVSGYCPIYNKMSMSSTNT